MKGLKPFLSLGLGFVAFVTLTACAGKAPPNGPGALTIAQFTLADGVVGVTYKQLLIVSGGVGPYTWTVTGGTVPPGLTVESNGIIDGTPTADGVYTFTAGVHDSQTPVAAITSTTQTITVHKALSLTTSALSNGVVGNAYTATLNAADGLPPYTYLVAFGSLPDGLTLTTNTVPSGPNSATIAGTPTAAGVFNFTIQASDSVGEVATAQYTITITGRLQGGYTLTFNGFSDGQPFYMIGSFIADGSGNITSGVLDQNGPSGVVSTNVALTAGSVYNVPSGSNLGTMTLVSSLGTFVYDIVVSTSAESKFILVDTQHPIQPHVYGSGLLKKQATTTLSGKAANYSFGLFGTDPGGARYAGAGMVALAASSGGSQAVTGGAEDTNDNGTVSGELIIDGGSFAATDTAGRGAANWTVNVGGSDVTYNYVYYVISATEVAALSIDSGKPQTLVSLIPQQLAGATGGTFSNSSLTGQNVIALNGVSNASGTPVPEAAVGVVTSDGNGNLTRTDGLSAYFTDQNSGGTVSIVQYTSGTYNVDPTCGALPFCGRVTVNLPGAPTQPVWYLANSGLAFVVGTDPDVTSGSLQAQTSGTTGFTVASILGSYLGGTITPVLASLNNQVDVATTPFPGGTFAINFDSSGPAGVLTNQNTNYAYDCDTASSTTCSTIGTAFGRFETTNNNTGADNGRITIMYIVGSGAAGTTGGKTGIVSLNLGAPDPNDITKTVPDPLPILTTYGH